MSQPRIGIVILVLILSVFWPGCRSELPADSVTPPSSEPAKGYTIPDGAVWVGVHVSIKGPSTIGTLLSELPALQKMGVNLLITEINYNFQYVSHPELRSEQAVSKAAVRRLAAGCRRHRIRLIPQFQCLGHQSWGGKTHPLLKAYPRFDETPNRCPDNKGIYARSWCPLHPEVNRIVFDLFDELLDAFEADGLHVGLDEVFIIASDDCPRCRGKDPGVLFARAVNDYHDHIVKKRGKEMFMWADRLINAKAVNYGRYEASANGTHTAVDRIPKDIILCDWHYEKRKFYPSIPLFLKKGFRVLPASWKNTGAVETLIGYSLEQNHERMLGHLATTWTTLEKGFSKSRPQIETMVTALTAEQPAPPQEETPLPAAE